MNGFIKCGLFLMAASSLYVVVSLRLDAGFVMSRYSVVHCLLLPVAVIAIGYGFVKTCQGETFSRALLLAALAVTGFHLYTVQVYFRAAGAV